MRRIVYILLFVAPILSCKNSGTEPVRKENLVHVRVSHPEHMEIRESISASGMLDTKQQVKLSFKTGGIIQSVKVREGEKVAEGTILATLDLSEVNAAVRQAGIACDKAERDMQRAENLYKDSVVTLEVFQNAKSAHELAAAQKQVAEFNLLHSVIKAPSNGKIQKILSEKSEIVGPGQPVVLFASTEGEWIVRTTLTDKDIVKLRPGDSAYVVMDAFPGKRFAASIWELGAIADPVTGTYAGELMLETRLPEFRAGYMAHATLYTQRTIEGWWLPFGAVLDMNDDRAYVFVADSTVAHKREIRTGPVVDKGILVMEGLNWDDPVITVGAKYLTDGQKIRLVVGENAIQ